MEPLDKINLCNKAVELLTLISSCDDWYFADFIAEALVSGNIRDLEEAKAAITLYLN